jgi:hypothetical protein
MSTPDIQRAILNACPDPPPQKGVGADMVNLGCASSEARTTTGGDDLPAATWAALDPTKARQETGH